MIKETPNIISEKVVRCRCGEKLYERINLIYSPWTGQAFKRTLHDNKGNQITKCPKCNIDFALPPPLPENERIQLREKKIQRYAHIDLSTHEARSTFFPTMQFKQLIQRQLNRSMQQIAESINSEMILLKEKERKVSEILIDIFNAQAYRIFGSRL